MLRQSFNSMHAIVFWPLCFINKLAAINQLFTTNLIESYLPLPSIKPSARVAETWPWYTLTVSQVLRTSESLNRLDFGQSKYY